MPSTTVKLLSRDLLALPADGKRHELIGGDHYVNASPTPRHQAVLANLGVAIYNFVIPRRLGQVFFVPVDVLLSDRDVVVPDLVYIRRERLAIIEDRWLRGAPDLAVEVLSPSTRRVDLQTKRDTYRKFGFGEYWIVDPIAETILVFRGEGDWTEPALRLSRASGPSAPGRDPAPLQHLSSPLLPGLVLTLDQIFAPTL